MVPTHSFGMDIEKGIIIGMNKLKLHTYFVAIFKHDDLYAIRYVRTGRIDYNDGRWNINHSMKYMYEKHRQQGSAVAWIN